MTENEREIIALINEIKTLTSEQITLNKRLVRTALIQKFKDLQENRFGQCTQVFLDTILNTITTSSGLLPMFHQAQDFWASYFWLLIENYIVSKNAPSSDVAQKWERLQKEFIELCETNKQIFKQKDGAGNLDNVRVIDKSFMRNIYLSQSAEVIRFFFDTFPKPDFNIFKVGDIIPEILKTHYKDENLAIEKFLRANSMSINQALNYEKRWRAHKRREEEIERIKNRNNTTRQNAIKIMDDANTPYRPKYRPELADRIMDASKKLSPFPTAHHLTAGITLTQILNTPLEGQRNLLGHGVPFRRAALQEVDMKNGDGNAICCGLDTGTIDPKCLKPNTVKITFDLQKMQQGSHFFYKQRDFGYFLMENSNKPSKYEWAELGSTRAVYKKRKVRLENAELQFTHKLKNENYVFKIIMIDGEKIIEGYAKSVLKDSLIAYDLSKMPQILVLNFFRFLDALESPIVRECIYAKIDNLSNENLLRFLTELRPPMIDTSELNVSGSHWIRLPSILSITSNVENPAAAYTLELPPFIQTLRDGNVLALKEANDKIQALFQSYRFMDYLLAIIKRNTKTKAVRDELLMLRASCPLPRQPWQQQLRNQERKLYNEECELYYQQIQAPIDINRSLATLYVQGLGVPQDFKLAAEFYQKAADLGDTAAQYHLAILCNRGFGREQDCKYADELYRQVAVDLGAANAQNAQCNLRPQASYVIPKAPSGLLSRNITNRDKLLELLTLCMTKNDQGALPAPELALRRAAANGEVNIVEGLIAYVKDLDISQPEFSSQKTALILAQEGGHFRIVQLLQQLQALPLCAHEIRMFGKPRCNYL